MIAADPVARIIVGAAVAALTPSMLRALGRPWVPTAATGVLALVRLAVDFLPGADAVFLVVLLGLALLTGSGLSVTLPEHAQARVRRTGDTLEGLALFAVIPLLIGYFGIYASLLETF